MNMAKLSLIYEGTPSTMAGERTHQCIKVSYTTRWSILLNAPKYLQELFQQQQRTKLSSKKKRNLQALKKSESEFA